MEKRLFHINWLNSLDYFFDRLCTIQEKTNESVSESGMVENDWTDVFSGVPAMIGKESGQEVKATNDTYSKATHRIVLKGLFDVKSGMRAVVDGLKFDILYPIADSKSQKTSLIVQFINHVV